MEPWAVGHWHLPSSRFTTSRFTFAGTLAFLFPCFSMSASKASFRICSSVAPGFRCDSPAFAFLRSARNSRETVMWRRLSVAVIGSTVVIGTTAVIRSTVGGGGSTVLPAATATVVRAASSSPG